MPKSSQQKSISIGIVGWGSFSRFIAPLLAKHATVYVYARPEKQASLEVELKNKKNVRSGSEADLRELAYFVFSVPLGSLESVAKEYSNKLNEKTIIVDVTSVKVRPLQILKKYFKKQQILGTHPIFGPQSGKNGIAGLPIVLCNVSVEKSRYARIKRFLSSTFGLSIIEQTAEQHDREIAYVQGLAHFIGRALKEMNIREYSTSTESYKQLLQLVNLIGDDSFELYKTIQNGNKYTKNVRKKLLDTLTSLEKKIEV
jgi:prephenate dehydrogenase